MKLTIPKMCTKVVCISLGLLGIEFGWSALYALHGDLLPMYVALGGFTRHKLVELHQDKGKAK